MFTLLKRNMSKFNKISKTKQLSKKINNQMKKKEIYIKKFSEKINKDNIKYYKNKKNK